MSHWRQKAYSRSRLGSYIRSLDRRLQRFEERRQTSLEPQPLAIQGLSPKQSTRDALSNTSNQAGPPRHEPIALAKAQQETPVISADPEIFLGGNAGFSFTQLILNAMNCPQKFHALSTPRDGPRALNGPDISMVPARGPELIKVYLGFHHQLMPIFHSPSIIATFDQVFACDAAESLRDHRYTVAIMNMMCAIAASHQRLSVGESGSAARKFYDTAMALVQPRLLADWSLEKVQILLLGARYLQSSSSPDECWNVLGLAIRIAYGLELHHAPAKDLDCITKEVRKRVWYACFGFDQLISMIYGRPASTSSQTATTPLPEDLDDDCIQSSRLLYPSVRTTSGVSFFLQVSRLYRLLELTVSVTQPSLENLMELDESFEGWLAQVPADLRIREDATVEDDTALILALRANMVRLLIHRQSLALSLSAMSTKAEGGTSCPLTGLRRSALQTSRQICIRTAEETIGLVGRRHERTKNAQGPSWFNLYYCQSAARVSHSPGLLTSAVFNAILIIVSHVVHPEFKNDKTALIHLEEAVRMIRQISANHSCAQRAYAFLQQLLGLLDKTLVESRPLLTPRPERQSTSCTMADNASEELGDAALWSFWDATQDLTSNLGSQLDLYGPDLWPWDSNNAEETAIPGPLCQPAI